MPTASFIASLRSNGWAVSGKLRRDQPNILRLGGRLHHLQDAIVEAVKEMMTRHKRPGSLCFMVDVQGGRPCFYQIQ